VHKMLIVTFRGEMSCVQHGLLNVLDMAEKDIEARLILEGESTRLVRDLEEARHPLYLQAKEKGLIAGICQACSKQMGALEYNKTVGLPILNDLSGHPALEPYIQNGYQIITL
jgi:hypothetical protein